MQRSYSVADVSVCVAYWLSERHFGPVAATVASTLRRYPEVEISLCDDGSPAKPLVGDCPQVREIVLPAKGHALNPCVPINAAVGNSTRPVIVLTNPGTEIPAGALERMLEELDEKTYVAAACRDVDSGHWLCHSTWRSSEALPPGAGFHFLAALERSLWDLAGGFDEDYRAGQAYEDADFLWRLHAVGARFKILDDIVITHRRSTTVWPAGGLERNRQLYREKRAAC